MPTMSDVRKPNVLTNSATWKVSIQMKKRQIVNMFLAARIRLNLFVNGPARWKLISGYVNPATPCEMAVMNT